MSCTQATVTVSRADWDRMMSMLESLSAQQAELNKTQASLVAQLARANARIDELTAQNEKLSAGTACAAETPAPGVVPPQGATVPNNSDPTLRSRATSGFSPPFTYVVKSAPQPMRQKPKMATTKKTWAQIAAEHRPRIQDVSTLTMERLRKGMAMLDIQSPEPKPTALYFRNIKRARLGQVRKALRQMFSHPWAVLGLSFIGQSVVEIVCHTGLCDQVIAKLRLIGAAHIRNLDVFGDNMKKASHKDGHARRTANLEKAHRRFERLVSTCTNTAAKAWYRKQAEAAEARLTNIYQAAHDVETSVSEDSGYDSNEVMSLPTPSNHSSDRTTMDVAPTEQPPSSLPTVADPRSPSDDDDIIMPAQTISNTAHDAPNKK